MPMHIIQDDYSDLPYEIYSKDMEIPIVKVEIDTKYLGFKLVVVPERLKNKLLALKEFRDREKVGVIHTSIDEPDVEEEEYDEIEQVFTIDRSRCKYKLLYGDSDFRNISIFKLRGSKTLVIEVPVFRNFIMHNVFSRAILTKLIPNTVEIVIEHDDATTEQISSSIKQGKFHGPNGENGITGIAAAVFNQTKLVPVIETKTVFRCVQLTSESLYL